MKNLVIILMVVFLSSCGSKKQKTTFEQKATYNYEPTYREDFTPTFPEKASNFKSSGKLSKPYLKAEIKRLESKIKDTERSLERYQKWGEQNPTATNAMLQQSTFNLLQTYQNQKLQYEMELNKY